MSITSPIPHTEPSRECDLCPRLVGVRQQCRADFPDWWNAPVPALGDPNAWLAIVGLAPGKHGANRTGRAFTGDASGDLLWATLTKFGFVEQREGEEFPRIKGVVILNAVKCLPPENKPTSEEIRTCRPHLEAALDAMPKVRTVLALGQIAHQSAVKAMGGKLPKLRFAHGAVHRVPDGRMLIDSYHCSRYNQNTGRLTAEMFDGVFEQLAQISSANRP
jgi:uracil-DNA glycosylase family 4